MYQSADEREKPIPFTRTGHADMSPLTSFLKSSFFRTSRQAAHATTIGRSKAAAAIERQKRPTRGGRNLSDRYHRLEKFIRRNEALVKSLDTLSLAPISSAESQYPSSSIPRQTNANTFRGFKIPDKPNEPEADECCMSGCAICVYDLHHESLTAYNESLASLRASLLALHIPESKWPSSVRASPAGPSSNVSLNAFDELERAIKERKAENNVGP